MLSKMLEGRRKVAILGVGSETNGDDMAGILAAEKLMAKAAGHGQRARPEKADVFIAGQAPENFTHLSKKNYSHIIIIDAVHFGGKPGEVRYFEGGTFAGGGISTHKLPLKLFIEYMQNNCHSKIIIAGIEPKNLEFGAGVSEEVERGIERLTKEIEGARMQPI